MASEPGARLTTRRVVHAAVLAVSTLCVCPAAAQTAVRLDQINARRPPDFAPVLDGRLVSIEATVASTPLTIDNYTHLALHGDAGAGVILEGSARLFSAFQPGDRVAVRGAVSKRAGLPVVIASSIELLTRGPAPQPRKLAIAEIQNFSRMGLLVTSEGRVVERGENTGGEYLLIGSTEKPLKVFLPTAHAGNPRFKRIEAGDKVRVTGVASQYCPLPPFDRYFEVIVAGDEAVVLLQKRWLVRPETFVLCLIAFGFALVVWWTRERRMSAQRKLVRTFYSLAEETIGAATPADIVRQIGSALPPVMNIAGAHLYLYNRAAKTLDRVPRNQAEPAFAVPVFAPEGSLPCGPAVSFRNQALLMIHDTRRSPFFPDGRPEGRPRSVLFIPMFAEAELVGILEFFDHKPMHDLSKDEKVLAQHLSNQIAIALRLMEEKSIREQLFRSEKLAAVGQLVSGVAQELRSPIENIAKVGDSLVQAPPSGALWSDVRTIVAEAQKAREILGRLTSFMQPARAEARRIDFNALLHRILDFRREQWREGAVAIRTQLCPYPVYVLGSPGQLERVFLDLIIQAEQGLADAADKSISVTSGVLARRVLVEISFAVNPSKAFDLRDETVAIPGESVTRSIVQSHGGEVRMVRSPSGECRIELELPVAVADSEAAAERVAHRQLTCLVVEPDRLSAAELTNILTGSGCRVIPAGSAEEGVELVQRMRFDVVFSAIRLPGLNWVQFSELVRPNIGRFVLLADGFDWEVSRGLVSGDSYVLAKPIAEAELERVLSAIDGHAAGSRLQVVHPKRAAK